MRSLLAVFLLAGPAASAPLDPPAPPQAGQGERVVIQAEGAWVGPDIRISPAFVLIQGDEILSVSRRAPRTRRATRWAPAISRCSIPSASAVDGISDFVT